LRFPVSKVGDWPYGNKISISRLTVVAMQDGQDTGSSRFDSRTSGGVAQFAFEVVARLVAGDVITTT
jgi:hypothetical protein